MKKSLLLLLVFVTSLNFAQSVSSKASNTLLAKKVHTQAKRMGKMLLRQNYSGYAKYAYPAMVELVGGETAMTKGIETSFLQINSKGGGIQDVIMGSPSPFIQQGSELQCTVPQTIIIKMPLGKMVATSTLIAVSTDGGNRWYFIDTSNNDLSEIRQYLPSLSSSLVVPPKTEPVFVKD